MRSLGNKARNTDRSEMRNKKCQLNLQLYLIMMFIADEEAITHANTDNKFTHRSVPQPSIPRQLQTKRDFNRFETLARTRIRLLIG